MPIEKTEKLNPFDPIFPMLRRIYSKLIASEIVSIQPMELPFNIETKTKLQ